MCVQNKIPRQQQYLVAASSTSSVELIPLLAHTSGAFVPVRAATKQAGS